MNDAVRIAAANVAYDMMEDEAQEAFPLSKSVALPIIADAYSQFIPASVVRKLKVSVKAAIKALDRGDNELTAKNFEMWGSNMGTIADDLREALLPKEKP